MASRNLGLRVPRTPVVRFERRQSSRIHTVMRVAKVIRAEDVGLWRVRDISDDGMMLATSQAVRPGEPMTIALSDSFTISARAIWCEGGRCGVRFEEPVDCAVLLRALVAEQRKPDYRPPRLPVDAHATAYCERGLHGVHLHDLSQRGATFSHNGAFVPGMQAKLLFANGEEHRGVVRWSEGGRAGIELSEPFPCETLESAAAF